MMMKVGMCLRRPRFKRRVNLDVTKITLSPREMKVGVKMLQRLLSNKLLRFLLPP